MKINEKIQQGEFGSSLQKAVVNILFTNNWVLGEIALLLKPYGVTHQQYNVLRVLAGRCPEVISMGELKKAMIDKKPDLTRLMGRLVQKDLAERKVCDTNRRSVEAVITARGLKLVETIRPKLDEMLEKEMNLSEGEAEVLSRLLDKIRN